jgi:leucyl aminopeptidase
MASPRAPRLIDFTWGDPSHPKVTLVGKGVCFDTGGLDLKPSSGMLIMKKDMGGAANVLALALMVMDAGLKVRLRVLIPAVENAVAGNAFRPLDIFPSRKGLTWRSATPTPKAGWCWPMRWRSPMKRSPIC